MSAMQRIDRLLAGHIQNRAAAAVRAQASRLIRAAPSGVVAVPITRAPSALKRSAMAAPMPREAPVTNATCSVQHGGPFSM